MDLAVIEMPEEEAKKAFEEYRDAVRAGPKSKLDEAQREYEEMDCAVMRGYKELAKGRQLLKLSETIAAGGVKEIEATYRSWTGNDWEMLDTTVFAPAIAVTRADARTCWTVPMLDTSAQELHANEWRGSAARKADTVVIPAGTFSGADEYGSRGMDMPPTGIQWSVRLRAIVPTIPPALRPPLKLSGYHILWEAEWTQHEVPVPPGDPALLRHLGGDLYAVLAVWDLTELERAVLSVRGE